MAHWDLVLPGKVLRFEYEGLVADPEREIRRLLSHCGLRYEAASLDFHSNTRAVRTASSEQVRRPINKDGLHAWRKFEPYLSELTHALAASA